IFLPSRIPLGPGRGEQAVLAGYRLLAIQQALRCARGAAGFHPHRESRLVRDLFLISEVASSDVELVRLVPGYRGELQALRQYHLARRPAPASLEEPARQVEELYRSLLACRVESFPG